MKRQASAVAAIMLSAVLLTFLVAPSGTRSTAAGSSDLTPTVATSLLPPSPAPAVPQSVPQAAVLTTNQPTSNLVAASITRLNNTTYAIADGLSDDSGQLPDQADFPVFENDMPIAGTYVVRVIGTGTGPYRLD
jgi:hypothetical protein